MSLENVGSRSPMGAGVLCGNTNGEVVQLTEGGQVDKRTRDTVQFRLNMLSEDDQVYAFELAASIQHGTNLVYMKFRLPERMERLIQAELIETIPTDSGGLEITIQPAILQILLNLDPDRQPAPQSRATRTVEYKLCARQP